MSENQTLLIDFIKWLKTKGINLLHAASLTTPNDKGVLYLVEDFLEQKGD